MRDAMPQRDSFDRTTWALLGAAWRAVVAGAAGVVFAVDGVA